MAVAGGGVVGKKVVGKKVVPAATVTGLAVVESVVMSTGAGLHCTGLNRPSGSHCNEGSLARAMTHGAARGQGQGQRSTLAPPNKEAGKAPPTYYWALP